MKFYNVGGQICNQIQNTQWPNYSYKKQGGEPLSVKKKTRKRRSFCST